MSATDLHAGPIHIDWAEDGTVLVTGHDEHRFLMTMQAAAEACAGQ